MATITDKEELMSIYERDLKEGIINEGLYSILPQGAVEGKENPIAFVTHKQSFKQASVHSLFEAILSWDGMKDSDECPITMIGTTLIIEPVKLYNV